MEDILRMMLRRRLLEKKSAFRAGMHGLNIFC